MVIHSGNRERERYNGSPDNGKRVTQNILFMTSNVEPSPHPYLWSIVEDNRKSVWLRANFAGGEGGLTSSMKRLQFSFWEGTFINGRCAREGYDSLPDKSRGIVGRTGLLSFRDGRRKLCRWRLWHSRLRSVRRRVRSWWAVGTLLGTRSRGGDDDHVTLTALESHIEVKKLACCIFR